MFRDLLPLLADRYHVLAPDLPGFGFSDAPDRTRFDYTFDHLAKVIEHFTDAVDLQRYTIYVFDYGAPVGLRLALARPERVTAIVSQNGNAYEEGLSQGWEPDPEVLERSQRCQPGRLARFPREPRQPGRLLTGHPCGTGDQARCRSRRGQSGRPW